MHPLAKTSDVTFKNITHPFIQHCFYEALQGFPRLHRHGLVVRWKSGFSSTMRAQPVLNWRFWNRKRRAFRIEISTRTTLSEQIRLADLPASVLIGWFAHELGHVMDYIDRSGWDLLRFGMGYWLFPTHRLGAERKADIYAIEHGYANYLLATKKFILEHSDLPNAYKNRIRKYYMTPEEVRLVVAGQPDVPTLRMDTIF
jgi:hypothetical protein